MPLKGSKKGIASKSTSAKKTTPNSKKPTTALVNPDSMNDIDEVSGPKKMQPSKKFTTTTMNANSHNDIGALSIFPAEIVLNIFTYLDYFDVKCCLMVSKTFETYCRHGSLDKVMFRNVVPLVAGTRFRPKTVKIHPCLTNMAYECSTNINHAWIVPSRGKHGGLRHFDHAMYPLVRSSAIDEYATMPAMKAIKIKIYEDSQKGLKVNNEMGVTVRNMLEALVAYFSVEIPGVMLYNVCPGLAGTDIDNCPATRSDMMGAHTGWSGFHRRSVDKHGVLMLVIDGFLS